MSHRKQNAFANESGGLNLFQHAGQAFLPSSPTVPFASLQPTSDNREVHRGWKRPSRAQASVLKRIQATTHIRKLRGGSQSSLFQVENGDAYVVKFTNNPQGRRTLVNEVLTSAVYRHLRIATPEIAQIWVSEGLIDSTPELTIDHDTGKQTPTVGWHFGSRYPGNPDTTAVYDSLPTSMLVGLHNRIDFWGAFVADCWLGASDPRQCILLRGRVREFVPSAAVHGSKRDFVVQMIDHGHNLGGRHWTFPREQIYGVYVRHEVYDGIKNLYSFQPWLEQVYHFPNGILKDACSSIPSEWIQGDGHDLAVLLEQLVARRRRIEELLVSAVTRHRRAFRTWEWRAPL